MKLSKLLQLARIPHFDAVIFGGCMDMVFNSVKLTRTKVEQRKNKNL